MSIAGTAIAGVARPAARRSGVLPGAATAGAPALSEVVIEGRGTAFPGHVITTDQAIDLVVGRGVSRRAAQRLASTAQAGDIAARQIVSPVGWYAARHTFEERVAVCDVEGSALAGRAAAAALADARCAPQDVGTVVFASSTMLSMPSPDARLINDLGLDADVMRVPVWGRGCAGGASALGLASRLAQSQDSAVLLVVVETCTAHGHADDTGVLSLLIALLYGDGAVAMVLRRRPRPSSAGSTSTPPAGEAQAPAAPPRQPLKVIGAQSTLVPDSTALGGWDVDGAGLHYRHLPEIAEVSAREVPQAVHACAERLGLAGLVGSGRLWAALHPTSSAVMRAQAAVLGLHPEALEINLEAFARFGNTSAPSVLIALDEIVRRAPLDAPVLALATGPGYSIEQVWLQT